MTPNDPKFAFAWGAVICSAGLVLNLFMIRKRGAKAVIMALSFLALGIALWLLSRGVSALAVSPLLACVFGLLVYDAVLKTRARAEQTQRRGVRR